MSILNNCFFVSEISLKIMNMLIILGILDRKNFPFQNKKKNNFAYKRQ